MPETKTHHILPDIGDTPHAVNQDTSYIGDTPHAGDQDTSHIGDTTHVIGQNTQHTVEDMSHIKETLYAGDQEVPRNEDTPYIDTNLTCASGEENMASADLLISRNHTLEEENERLAVKC